MAKSLDVPVAAIPLAEIAGRLAVSEAQVREWLGSFAWEGRYDAHGQLWLTERDAEFLGVVKQLREADRTCESIVRLIGGDDPSPDLAQIASLKAAMRDLHAPPARKPFWKFWARV